MADEKKKGKGLLKTIVNLGFKEVPDQSAPATPTTGPRPADVASGSRPSLFVSPTVVDQNFLQALKANVLDDDSDYAKFLRNLEALSSVIPDEATRFKAAFTTAGVNRAGIEQAIELLLKRLETEMNNFTKQANESVKAKVGTSQTQLDDITNTIKEKREQISALQQEITSLDSQARVIKEQMDAEVRAVEEKRQKFATAHGTLRQQVETHLKQVKEFLK